MMVYRAILKSQNSIERINPSASPEPIQATLKLILKYLTIKSWGGMKEEGSQNRNLSFGEGRPT